MKNAIILHGKPSKTGYYKPERQSQSNEHWIPWLQHELIIRDILTQTPEWPRPYEPDYKSWLKIFNQFDVNENTIIIGHSCGAGFLLRWLSENDVKVDKVFLIAPSMNPKNTINGFFDFKVDPNIVQKTAGVTIYSSVNDERYILDTVRKIKELVKDVKYKEFENYGHFIFSHMKKRDFPELLEDILST